MNAGADRYHKVIDLSREVGRHGEGVLTLRQDNVADVCLVDGVLTDVERGKLGRWSSGIVIFEKAKEFLEVHASENNIRRLSVSGIEV